MSQITCRAALLYEEGKPQVIESVLIDPPRGNQVRVKIVAAGICASDGLFAWGKQKPSQFGMNLPLVLGHESSGIVESVGEDVTSLRPGDRVLTNFMPNCNACSYCANATNNFCQESAFVLGALANKKQLNGTGIQGLGGLGVFSEYILVKSSQIVKINSDVNLRNASIISCAVMTGFYSTIYQANVQPGSSVAIWGMGAIGLNAAFGARFAGAKHIIGIDINNTKREIALEFGCTEFINSNELNDECESVADYLKSKYGGGVDYALDCAGVQSVIKVAFKSLSPFGTLALVGVGSPEMQINFPALDFLTGRKIIGGLYGNKRGEHGFPEIVEMYAAGKYNIDPLVTHEFRLEQINEAFQTLKEGRCIRSIIVFD